MSSFYTRSSVEKSKKYLTFELLLSSYLGEKKQNKDNYDNFCYLVALCSSLVFEINKIYLIRSLVYYVSIQHCNGLLRQLNRVAQVLIKWKERRMTFYDNSLMRENLLTYICTYLTLDHDEINHRIGWIDSNCLLLIMI